MSAFASWLLGLCQKFIIWLYNNGIDLIQALIDGFFGFVTTCVQLLPDGGALPGMPEQPSSTLFHTIFDTVAWVFPVGYACSLVTFVIAAYVAYWVIAPFARWLKLLT